MSIVVVGASHRTAPLDLLERMAVRGDALPKFLHHLDGGEHTSEAVVLATCNRTEVYLVAERFHGAFGEVRDCFADLTYLPPDQFADSLYVHYDDQAVSHLFGVSAGLDSVVLGEHEILGQVKVAWETARREGTSGRNLNLLFRQALEVGKRARTETGIGTHTTSVSQAAVRIAVQRLGALTDRRAVLLGAGAMGRAMASFLGDEGVAEVVVANRTLNSAMELTAGLSVPARAVTLDGIREELRTADVVFAATGASSPLLDEETVGSVMRERHRPLLVIDVAVPRDVDPRVGDIDSVELLDMTSVADITGPAMAERRREAAAVQEIVNDELVRFAALISAREVAPLITGLRERAETVRLSELQRHSAKLAGLDASQREAVDALTRAMVAKLLHDPTVRLKSAAGTSRGDRMAASLADLFDL